MKKLFLLLLAILGLLTAFILERGTLIPLIPVTPATVVGPLFLGVLLTTLFSFRLKEIAATFKLAFSEESEPEPALIKDYRKSLLIVRNLQSATTCWAGTIFILAVVQLLSTLTTPAKMGPFVAAALSAIFYGFALRAALFIPMEHSLTKKVLLTEDKNS